MTTLQEAVKKFIEATKLDRIEFEDWPRDSQTAFESLRSALEQQELPVINANDRQWLADNPNADDIVEFIENYARAALANAEPTKPNPKLWLWKNFVDGKQEYWAFDNLYPININDDDPQTLGNPCGYALFKPSRNGRKDTL